MASEGALRRSRATLCSRLKTQGSSTPPHTSILSETERGVRELGFLQQRARLVRGFGRNDTFKFYKYVRVVLL